MSTQDIPTTDEDLLTLDELEAAWNAQADAFNSWDELGIDEIIWFAQQQALARAALAQPEPEVAGPSDEELEALAQELDDVPVQAVFAFARAVLARWGGPAIQPVPGKDRSPDTYWERHVQATNAAGPGGPTWNQSYLAELQRRGLALATARPPHDCDAWYLSGAPMEAPLPHPDGGITWPPGTLIIWAPPVPIPTSQEVL